MQTVAQARLVIDRSLPRIGLVLALYMALGLILALSA